MKKRVVIIDAASDMRKIVGAMLAGQYETACASSGEEAVQLCVQKKPDLILMDLMTPGMSGQSLQEALRKKYPDEIPIIFMSTDENEENESRGLASGAMDFIRKPFRQDVLLRRVGNILRQVEQLRALRLAAETDPMTGLYNKTHTQQVLSGLCGSVAGTLMMVDLDSFKLVNDLYGHDTGDRVLIRFAEILRGVIRSSDIAGRVGGDEFILFCRDIGQEEVIAGKTRRINEFLLSYARELLGKDMTIPLGASIGAVVTPDEGTDFWELYKKADKALYRVKRRGNHGYAFFRGKTARSEPAQESSEYLICLPDETQLMPDYSTYGYAYVSPATLESAQTILEERNRKKGAYELGFENFRSVYRFLIRSIENYHRQVELILFTLHEQGDGTEALDRFGETLGSSLRRSDVYTRSGDNQYMALLSETGEENESVILDRVLKNWEAAEGSTRPDISWESTVLTVT